MKYFAFLLLTISVFSWQNANARNLPSSLKNAQFYFLIDGDTKETLLSKNADVRIPPSSMTKMMTAYVIFNQIRKGAIKLDNQCLIGRDAYRKSGSSMFLNYGDVVTIDELLRGLLAVSGNDAAIALAQASAGGYQNFIKLMNKTAKEIGLRNSNFKNPHGLNEKDHYMSLRDLAILTAHIYDEFPQYSSYFSIPEFTYGRVTQKNRHPLIKGNYDAQVGGKTGHTNQGGYGAVSVVKKGNRKLIAVVNKAKTPRLRAQITTDLVDFAFENYKKLVIFEKNQMVAKLPIWLGLKNSVGVVTNREIALNVEENISLNDVEVKIKFLNPIKAPIAKGEKIADLLIEINGFKNLQYSLFASENIARVGSLEKFSIIFSYKLDKLINKIF